MELWVRQYSLLIQIFVQILRVESNIKVIPPVTNHELNFVDRDIYIYYVTLS